MEKHVTNGISVPKTYDELFAECAKLCNEHEKILAENAKIREMAEKVLHQKRALEAENAQIKQDIKTVATFVMEKFGLGNPEANIANVLMSLAKKFMFSGKDALIVEFQPLVKIVVKYIPTDDEQNKC